MKNMLSEVWNVLSFFLGILIMIAFFFLATQYFEILCLIIFVFLVTAGVLWKNWGPLLGVVGFFLGIGLLAGLAWCAVNIHPIFGVLAFAWFLYGFVGVGNKEFGQPDHDDL